MTCKARLDHNVKFRYDSSVVKTGVFNAIMIIKNLRNAYVSELFLGSPCWTRTNDTAVNRIDTHVWKKHPDCYRKPLFESITAVFDQDKTSRSVP